MAPQPSLVRIRALGALLAAALCAGLTGRAESAALKFPDVEIEPLAWSRLEGWAGDDHRAAFAAFRTSCALVVKPKSPQIKTALGRELKSLCRRALRLSPRDNDAARAFFEANFRPLRISKLGEREGFLTGYYEPIAEGSRTPNGEYTVPMHRRPSDLVALRASRKTEEFPNKGPVGRKAGTGKLVDYFDRAAIEDGALAGRRLEICYLKDPIEAFFIHIQGSARIRLQEGGVLRINYDGHNGHRYTPVGRILIERNIVPKDEMSMERIRQWMLANPEEGRELRRQNRSYIFFRVARLLDHEEPVGAQGAPLTPGRSIAIDKALHAYGTPFWIEANLPIASEERAMAFRRLMIAQDTGSAIVGPARADLYFGAGEEAGRVAGRIRHPGRFVMLAPRRIAVGLGSKHVPLPRPRPPAGSRASEASLQSAPAMGEPGRGP